MIDVSIVIVNYNTAALIRDCVASICAKTEDIQYEIIIVDNQSSTNDLSILEEISTRYNIRIVASTQNLGFGKACNLGVKISTGRNILFLNPDTLLINNAILILSNYLDLHPEVGGCGANLFDNNMNANHSFKRELPGFWSDFKQLLPFELGDKLCYGINFTFNNGDSPLEVAYITGADLMIRREVLQESGLFDKDFFMYYEDTELCSRIKRCGYKLMNIPSAQIIHLEGQSFASMSQSRAKRVFAGRSVYYFKTGSSVRYYAANLVLSVAYLLRIIAFSILRRKSKAEESICKLKQINSIKYDSLRAKSNIEIL